MREVCDFSDGGEIQESFFDINFDDVKMVMWNK